MEKLNTLIFLWLNHFAGVSPVLDAVGILLAKYMPVVFAFWVLYWWFARGEEGRRIVLYVVESAALGLALNFVITSVYFHPRPFMLSLGKLLIPHAPETSFPSDHATLMLSMALTALCFHPTRRSGSVLLVLGLLGGLARVFCGLHFPLDIVGSLGVALIATALIMALARRLLPLNDRLLGVYEALAALVLPRQMRP